MQNFSEPSQHPVQEAEVFSRKLYHLDFCPISKFSKSWPKNCTIVWFYLRDFAVSLNLSQCPLWKPIRQVQSFCSKSSSEGLCYYMEPHLTILKVACYICCLTTETFLPHAAQERSLDCSRAV